MPKAPVRAKWPLPSWLEEQLSGVSWESLYEPFAGQAAVSRYFKRRGKQVIASDLLESHYCFLLGLVENDHVLVSRDIANGWLQLIKDPLVATRFQPWANTYVTPEEAIWLGVWNAHLSKPGLDPVQRALGAIAVALTLSYWLSFDPKAHPHKPMSPPVAFQHYLQTVNTWVCNNGRRNQALRGDAYALGPKVEADLLVCYPPTEMGFLDYPEPLRLFECWVQGDPALPLPGTTEEARGKPTLGTPLPDPDAYYEALKRFLSRSEHFPLWAIAFNDRYPLDEKRMLGLVTEFRPVVRRAGLHIATGERGPAPGERLLIAKAP